MPFCSCDTVTLYYEVHGTGSPLLLISGLGGTHESWYGQTPYFRQFYQTITFDNRGAGLSDTPPGPYDMKGFAEDTLCLLDHLRVERVFVLGLSMGGMIAQELALLAPKRIRALALGCTHCGGTARIAPSSEVVDTLINNEGLTQEQIVDKNILLFLGESCRKNRPEVVEIYRQEHIRKPSQPHHAFRAQLEAIRDFDCCGRISQIQVPTLIITGAEDIVVPPQNSRYLAQHIPDSRLVEIPGAGHALHAECRDEINEMVHGFFKQHEARSVSQ